MGRYKWEIYGRYQHYVDEAILERMAERLAARPELLDARRESVEHPFSTIKQWMGQGAFLTRRLENVRSEFSITALAYNIRREGMRRESSQYRAPHIDPRRPGAPSTGLPAPNRQITWDRRKSW